MVKRVNWTEDETIIALKLYFDSKNQENKIIPFSTRVLECSVLLSSRVNGNYRNTAAVSLKMGNLAYYDPESKSCRDHKSDTDGLIWNKYGGDIKSLNKEYCRILSRDLELAENDHCDNSNSIEKNDLIKLKFDLSVMNNYNNKCCITGLNVIDLLTATHIAPPDVLSNCNYYDPCNGLCMDVLHQRAFNCGLIAIDTDYTIMLSPNLKEIMPDTYYEDNFKRFDGDSILLPSLDLPDKGALEYHIENVFLC